MPTLASSVSSCVAGNDSPAMNRLTVKPMPADRPEPGQHPPAGVLGQPAEAEPHREAAREQRSPTGLPTTRPSDDAERHRGVERLAEHAAAEVDAGVGEREHRQHDVRRHRVQPGLQPLDDRHRLARAGTAAADSSSASRLRSRSASWA